MSAKQQSILLGGLVVAVLSTSYLGFINCLCCAGIIIGAMASVWHYTSTNELTIPTGEGAVMGLSAALVGFFIAFIINYILITIGIRHDLAITQAILNNFGDQMPPEQVEAMEDQMDAAITIGSYAINGLIGIVFSLIFGAIGGAIGAAVFKKGKEETPGEASDVI